MRLCILRGLISAIQIAFPLEDITSNDVKDDTRASDPPVPTPSDDICSVECPLFHWRVWLEFSCDASDKEDLRHNRLTGMVFQHGLCYARVTDDLGRCLLFSFKGTDKLLWA
jgi:hypothetical protein